MNIIFDFDGTIADTMPISINIIKSWNIMDGITFEQARSQGIKKTLEQLNISKTKLLLLIAKGRKTMSKQMDKVQTFDRIPEVLDKLKQDNKLGILTSNSTENVNKFLKNNEISNFDFVYSEFDLFGKAAKLKKIMKKYDFKPKETIYVGDETRDIEAAKKAGVKSVAVSWGYEPKEVLRTVDPDRIIDDPEELLTIF